MVARGAVEEEKGKAPCIDKSICLGCGVCALQCPTKSCKLIQREQRVIHPETTFERVILQCLEKGTLQNQLFTNAQRIDQRFMRAFVGGFLRLSPVKKALLSENLRSKFLKAMGYGLEMQGRGWLKNM
jgi:ferredoxin